MKCKKFEEYLYRYQELSAGEQKLLEAHCQECAACNTLAQEISVFAEKIRISRIKHIPRDPTSLTQKIMSKIDGEKNAVPAWVIHLQYFLNAPVLRYSLSVISMALIVFFLVEQGMESTTNQVTQSLPHSTQATLNTTVFLKTIQRNRTEGTKEKNTSIFKCLKKSDCNGLTNIKTKKFYAQR